MESSSRRSRTGHRRIEEGKLVTKVIWPAIKGHSCPICFRDLETRYKAAAVLTVCMHAYCIECIRKWSNLRRKCPLCNAEFNSWFCKPSLSSREFQKQVLPSEVLTTNPNEEARRRALSSSSIIVRRSRVELNDGRRRALPWRRSFGRPGLVSPDVIAQRKLEWRASIYNRGLRADPSTIGCLEQQNKSMNSMLKEKMIQRIEPWIWRELQAILGDPDPTVIVHVVTSQFIAWIQEKAKLPSMQIDVEDSFISPLRPFLYDKAGIFWHELRCFAESCYNMETYDAVVGYKHV